MENALIEWRQWPIDLKIRKNDVTDSYEGVYCNASFWICGPNRRYNQSNEALLAGFLETKGITLLQYFPV